MFLTFSMCVNWIIVKMPNMSEELDRLLDKIINSPHRTEASKTLQEIENNQSYILNVQLKKLLRLHDDSFKNKCVSPINYMLEKYTPYMGHTEALQKEAELVDRDLRILEMTYQLIEKNRNSK
ncbi:ATV_collapsed_G0039030.mRNA.1.CDS.1 [Saccharomyces cerevisiae]|nr:ATV_collapsed_G0039030.mRNA.1.CDS.1 [Saccharomyces cerevisiae]